MMGKTGHYLVRCPICQTVVEQCRCPGANKAEYYELCEGCRKAHPQPPDRHAN